jgi:hypothetical protein
VGSARVRFWDKAPALALLFKRLGLLEPEALPRREPTPLRILVQHGPDGPEATFEEWREFKEWKARGKSGSPVPTSLQVANSVGERRGLGAGSGSPSNSNGNGSRPHVDDTPDFTRRGGS